MAKSLVLYFSVYGTAKAVAEEIARQTRVDLMAIEPAVPYDSDRNHYNALANLPHDPQAGAGRYRTGRPASGNDGGGERRDGAGKEVAEGRRETFSRRNAHRRRIKTV